MAIRSREEEKDVLPDYLVKLHESHERWLVPRDGEWKTADKAEMVEKMLRSTLRLDEEGVHGPKLMQVDELVKTHADQIVNALPRNIRRAGRVAGSGSEARALLLRTRRRWSASPACMVFLSCLLTKLSVLLAAERTLSFSTLIRTRRCTTPSTCAQSIVRRAVSAVRAETQTSS